MIAYLAYLFFRPFLREGVRKRNQLAAKQRAERSLARRYRAGTVEFTDEEHAYMAAHVPARYRR